MFKTALLAVLTIVVITGACSIFDDPEEQISPPGDSSCLVIFDFNLPVYRISDELHFQYPMDDINREIFRYQLNIYSSDNDDQEVIYCAGLSRFKQFYSFKLESGNYSYDAAITCQGREILCDTVGFPEDRLIWTYGTFKTNEDSTLNISLDFIH